MVSKFFMSDHQERNTTISSGDASESLALGTIIARKYRVVSVLGSGGMGVVYLVKQIDLDKKFALKFLDVSRQTEVAVRRFHQEAKTAASLRHPNLVQVHDFGIHEETHPYLVMDYVQGTPLDQILKDRRLLPVEYVVPLAIQIGFGLMYAHEHGVVHRDIKPSNIIILNPRQLPTEGSVKIVDFGIAKLMQSEDGEIQQLTRTGEIFGSPVYMSPEQCRGSGVDQRSDIFSLGCVVYECLTGLPPFIGDTAMATMVKRLTEQPVPLKDGSLGLDFPPALETIVQKMLATEPEERYQDFSAVIQKLMRIDDPDAFIHAAAKVNSAKLPYRTELTLALVTAVVCSLSMYLVDSKVIVPNLTSAPILEPNAKVAAVPAASDLLPVRKLKRPWCEHFGTVNGAYDKLHFPSESGFILVDPADHYRTAIGDITVPPGSMVQFKLNDEAVTDNHFLDGLADVHFSNLAFNSPKVGVTNASMQIFAPLKHLKHLSLAGTPISVLEPIYHSPGLSQLDVCETHVPLSELLSIDRFKLFDNLDFGPVKNPGATLRELAKNKNLRSMKYQGPIEKQMRTNARGLDKNDVEDLITIPNLSNLAIMNCANFDDACLKQLLESKKFDNLMLQGCGITARSLPILDKQKLSLLRITTHGWKDAEISRLHRLRYKVEIVDSEGEEHETLNGKVKDTQALFFDAVDVESGAVKKDGHSSPSSISTTSSPSNKKESEH